MLRELGRLVEGRHLLFGFLEFVLIQLQSEPAELPHFTSSFFPQAFQLVQDVLVLAFVVRVLDLGGGLLVGLGVGGPPGALPLCWRALGGLWLPIARQAAWSVEKFPRLLEAPCGNVTAVELDGNGLDGVLPSELGLLESLVRLKIGYNFDTSAYNSLSGTIPSSLSVISGSDMPSPA